MGVGGFLLIERLHVNLEHVQDKYLSKINDFADKEEIRLW